MLSKLVIENYALIEQLGMEFPEGFSVITGETGAGKSILLGALSLILGNRGDTSVLLDKTRKCIVEGTFFIRGYHLEEFFSANELDFDETTNLRREISPNGKSRAFINDSPVNLGLMKELGDRLVNVHSQFSVITLNNADFQLAVLDNYSDNILTIQQYRDKYADLIQQKKVFAGMIQQEARIRSDTDYFQFLLEELESAKLREGEQEEAGKRLAILLHAEEIKSGLVKAIDILSQGEQNLVDRLSEIANVTNNLSQFHSSLKEISERIRSNQIDLRDIAAEMEHIEQVVEFDPDEAESLTARLDLKRNGSWPARARSPGITPPPTSPNTPAR